MEVAPNHFAFSISEALAALLTVGRAARTVFVASHHFTQMSFRVLGETAVILAGVANVAKPSLVASPTPWTDYYRSLEPWVDILLTWLHDRGYLTESSWIYQISRWVNFTLIASLFGKPFEFGLTSFFLVIFARLVPQIGIHVIKNITI